MPIDFQCSQCQHTLRVPDDSAGKKSRCPQCGNIQEIPYQPSPAPQPSATYSPPPGQAPYGGPTQPPNPPYAASPYRSPGAGSYGRQRKSLAEVQSRVKPPAIAMPMCASNLRNPDDRSPDLSDHRARLP